MVYRSRYEVLIRITQFFAACIQHFPDKREKGALIRADRFRARLEPTSSSTGLIGIMIGQATAPAILECFAVL